MTLVPGTRLGQFEILAPLGAGGMGEVYRARDSRLGRDVAVKLLPPRVAHDPERRARFEREARTISSLNHPHICTLFDVGEEAGSHFLVMELLEGESLADRLQRGPLPLEQVVKYGAQVADALDCAHRQGIVHRDLKPGNVMLTKTGAKLLDFGLARSSGEGSLAAGSEEEATEAKPLTAAGTVLGTYQYMAPEQLAGAEASPRTDIFALGAVLYEMATGKRAFEGKSKTSLVAAILSAQPQPISSVVAVVPPALEHVVRKCLEKEPEDRWQSAKDVASELRWIGEAGSGVGMPATVSLGRRKRERLAGMLGAWGMILGLAALAWALVLTHGGRRGDRPLRAELVMPGDVDIRPVGDGAIALSPDGERLAFLTGPLDNSRQVLAIRDMASGEIRRLESTEGASFPFWSPDGRWLAFFANRQLKKVESGGGPVQILCPAPNGRGGTWGRGDTIVFAPDVYAPLMRVPAGGGTPVATTTGAGRGVTHRNAHFLPDGRRFLFTVIGTEAIASVALGSLDGGEPRRLLESGSSAQFADGYLFLVRSGTLVAQRFDLGRLALVGPPIPVADAVEYFSPRNIANFSVSESGLLVYRRQRVRLSQLAWLDRSGREMERVGEPAYHSAGIDNAVNRLSLSADGRLLAAVRTDETGGNADVWSVDLVNGQAARVTFVSATGAAKFEVALSADHARVAASLEEGGTSFGRTSLWTQPVSGGEAQRVVEKEAFWPAEWSRDGRRLIGVSVSDETDMDLAYVSLDDPSKVVPLARSRFRQHLPAVSPNGRWIAFTSDETGRSDAFVADFPAVARKWQISRAGGMFVSWRGDGREVYFMGAEQIEAARVDETPEGLTIGPPNSLPIRRQDLAADKFCTIDGNRFLVLKHVGDRPNEPLRLIRSWRQLLEK